MITGTRAVGLYVPDQLRELATDFRVIEKAGTVRLKSQIYPSKGELAHAFDSPQNALKNLCGTF